MDVVTVQFADLITQLFDESRVGVGVATELWPFAPLGTRREHSEHKSTQVNTGIEGTAGIEETAGTEETARIGEIRRDRRDRRD